MFIPMAIIAALLWTHAEKIYQWHAQNKRENPLLFKITGFNEKYIDNPDPWIKHFRIYLTLFAGLFSSLLVMLSLCL